MCRFILYFGHPVYLEDVLVNPEHSLIHLGQDIRQYLPFVDTDAAVCEKRNQRINADG